MDTTYLLPFSRMSVAADLFSGMEERGIPIWDVGISSISLFELQAKAAKLGVNSKYVVDAIETISSGFRVEQIHNIKIIEVAASLLKLLNDYVDCLILATAIVLKEDLVTEDSRIHALKEKIKADYSIKIFNCKELLEISIRRE